MDFGAALAALKAGQRVTPRTGEVNIMKVTKAKFYVGLAGALVQAAIQFVGPDGSAGHWLALAAAVLTAVGVYALPNKQA